LTHTKCYKTNQRRKEPQSHDNQLKEARTALGIGKNTTTIYPERGKNRALRIGVGLGTDAEVTGTGPVVDTPVVGASADGVEVCIVSISMCVVATLEDGM